MCCRSDGNSQCSAVSVHPGVLDTSLARDYFKQMFPEWIQPVTNPICDKVLLPVITRRVEYGGNSVLAACLRPSNEVAGKYTAFGKVTKNAKVICLINTNS